VFLVFVGFWGLFFWGGVCFGGVLVFFLGGFFFGFFFFGLGGGFFFCFCFFGVVVFIARGLFREEHLFSTFVCFVSPFIRTK